MIDVQGTIIDDLNREAIDGAVEIVNSLSEKKLPFVLITNNTKFSSIDFTTYLRGLGFRFDDSQYIDPYSALKDIVADGSIWSKI